MSFPNIPSLVRRQWRPLVFYGALFTLVAFLLWWRLGTLLPGFSTSEAATYQASASLEAIYNNPINAPYHLAVRALMHLSEHSLLLTRLISVAIGMGTLIVFCLLARQWHGPRAAIIGTLLFGSSAWFLHTARLGTPDVMLFGLFALVACGYWLKQTGSRLALFLSFALFATLVFVPGMIWLLIICALWQWRTLDRAFKKHLGIVTLGGLLVVGALGSIGWAIYRNLDLLKPFLGLPGEWDPPLTIARHIAEGPLSIFVIGESNPVTWLGRLPLLDFFGTAMFILGVFLYWRYRALARSRLFIALAIAVFVLMGVTTTITLSALVPFIYLVVAAGVHYLLTQWFTVFPRNPIAQGIGLGLVIVVVGLVCIYQLRQYFVAWPHAPVTRTEFRQTEQL